MADHIRIAQDQFPPASPRSTQSTKPASGGSQRDTAQAKKDVEGKAGKAKADEVARLAAEKKAQAAKEAEEAEAKKAAADAERLAAEKKAKEESAQAEAEQLAKKEAYAKAEVEAAAQTAGQQQTGGGTTTALTAPTTSPVPEVKQQPAAKLEGPPATPPASRDPQAVANPTPPLPSLDAKKPEPASLGEEIGVALKSFGVDPVMHVALPSTLLALTMLTALLVSMGRSRSLKRERAATIAKASQQLQHPFRSLPEIADRAKQIADGGYQAAVQMHAQLEAANRREADVFASGDPDRQLRSLGLPVVLNIDARVQALLGELAHDPDYAAVDEVLHLGEALDSLREGLQEVSAGARVSERGVDPMTDVFYSGFEDGWFEELIKAELVLRAYAAPGSRWSELAEKLGVICSLGRTLLGLHGIEILTHPVPAPRTMTVRVYETDERGLRRIGFVREVMQRLVGARPAEQALVVDCVRLGTADRRSGKLKQPTVSLYNHMDWR